MAKLSEKEKKIYKKKMREIRKEYRRGNEEKANRIAEELKAELGIR